MKASELIEVRLARLRTVARALHKSLETERTYCGWVRRFIQFSAELEGSRGMAPEQLARLFVEAHAEGWAVATQDQFRNALVFYYKHVLKRPLGDLGGWSRARRPERLPVWLPHAQMLDLLSYMRDPMRLMAETDYGSGLRSRELVTLRVKDVDFTAKTITVRGGKGAKDRVTFLPESVIPRLHAQIEEMRRLFHADRRAGRPGVETPSRNFSGEDWQWFWVWAAPTESTDPRTGIVRRHHIHKSTLGKALAVAVKRWGGNQRVTQHSLRHSFATTLLDRGVGIHVLKELLGHKDIKTTEIYAHVLPRKAVVQATSPMDLAPPNVVPLAATSGPAETRGFSVVRAAL